MDFPPQPVITKDNVTMQIETVLYFQITDPKLYAYGAEWPMSAIENLSVTTMRNIIGDMDLEQTLTSRDTINSQMRALLDEATNPWGIKVNRVEVKNIQPPPDIQSAIGEADEGRAGEARGVSGRGPAPESDPVAEGEKESMIFRADAAKQAAIKKAEGEAEAILKVQQATAEAIKLLNEADPGRRCCASRPWRLSRPPLTARPPRSSSPPRSRAWRACALPPRPCSTRWSPTSPSPPLKANKAANKAEAAREGGLRFAYLHQVIPASVRSGAAGRSRAA